MSGRYQRACGMATLLACTAVMEVALAGGLDVQHFRPNANGQGLFGVESPNTLSPLSPHFELSTNMARGLLGVDQGGETLLLSKFQAITHIQAGLGILPWIDLAFDLPVALVNNGTSLAASASTNAGLGDLRITSRIRLLNRESGPLGLAVVLPLTLPTGSPDDYLGEDGLTFNPQVALAGDAGAMGWGMSLGYKLRPLINQYYEPVGASLQLDDEVTYGLATSIALMDTLRLGMELEGRLGFQGAIDRPLEARFGGKFRSEGGLYGFGGAGLGLIGGYGAPTWRVFAGVGYTLGLDFAGFGDSDRDGVKDKVDQCPDTPEDLDQFQDTDGCPDPDNDGDGILDVNDTCPRAAETANGFDDADGCPEADLDMDNVPDEYDKCKTIAEDQDGFEDKDGCPDEDNDGDGFKDIDDRCPDEAEDQDGFQDSDGCPDPDNDGDGVLDEMDQCPNKLETQNGYQDDDGCPERDRDSDGIPDAIDRCRSKAETYNGYKDNDGCPERDTDHDGIPDAIDKCRRKPETHNGFNDEDGCPEKDSDRDGIPDELDRCPHKPETHNKINDEDGCPD